MSARRRPVNQRSQVENTGGCRDNREILIRSCVAYTTPCGAWGGLHTVPQPKTSNPRASPELKIHQKSIQK